MWPASDGKMAAAVVQMCLGFRGVLAIRSRVGGAGALGLVSSQLRTFSVRKEPELEENPYYGKYRDKIQQLRRSDPGAFEARMEKQKEVKQQPLGTSRQAEYIRSVEEKVTSGSVKDGSTKNKMLNSLLNLELVTDKNAEDIKQIWNEYFSTKDTVYAVIPGEAFELIWRRAQSCPSTAGETAPSQLILYHYNELQKDKGIVLMNSEHDTKFLNAQEAQCLANQVQLFYSGDLFTLVETFNHNSSDFKYMAVVSALEQYGLGKAQGQH
ncbi:ATP synthase mitochondrial F1 complex assembly factor 1 isoform X4 [Pseudophryne corroboree]|uniref:ATP synthase mitochondrial F1 complex assembly factor 1 isoform X4 n=1 Tax=Pseudophryne corroboree TaxID=495146 RepID=UPI003082197C